MDFRLPSLQLYNQKVLVKLKPEIDSFSEIGESLTGKIIGRIWGSADFTDKNLLFPCYSTVVALTLQLPDKQLDIPFKDIESLSGIFHGSQDSREEIAQNKTPAN